MQGEYEEGEVVDDEASDQRQHRNYDSEPESSLWQPQEATVPVSDWPVVNANGPQSEEELVAEFYRLHGSLGIRDPQEHARFLVTKYSGRGEELKLALEQHYGVPRWFDTYEYDFRCRFFNPSKALYDPHVVPPLPNTPPLDNLAKAKLLVGNGQNLLRMVIWTNCDVSCSSLKMIPKNLCGRVPVDFAVKVFRSMNRSATNNVREISTKR